MNTASTTRLEKRVTTESADGTNMNLSLRLTVTERVVPERIAELEGLNALGQIALVAVYEYSDGDLYAVFDEPVAFPRECPGGGVHDFAYPQDGHSRCRKCSCNVTLTVGS